MAAERAQQDGYPARDRHPSDGGMPANNNSQHDSHHGAAAPPHHHHHHHRQSLPDVDRETFLRLEQQVAYNYSCIQEHSGRLSHLEQGFSQFRTDIFRALDDLRASVRTRGSAQESASQGRFDQHDVEVLAAHIANVTTKVNEIENVRIQVELLKTKLKRLEADSASHTLQIPPRPGTASSHREYPAHDNGPHPPPLAPHGHQPLPPIHTGVTEPKRHSGYQITPIMNPVNAAHPIDRPPSNEHNNGQYPPSQRPGEPYPPPSTIGWRPNAQSPYPGRPGDADVAPNNWAPVNNGPPKRPFHDPSARETSAPASPKRPKLAPLKPRSTYEDGRPTGSPPPYSNTDNFHASRMTHDGPPPPQLLTTPASATAGPNYRFITSTTPSEGPEPWRDHDGSLTPASARGRGRMRGRTRPPGGREGKQEQGTPEWEQKHNDWPNPHAQQPSPNGYYNPNMARPLLRPGEGPQEYPLTPIASAVSPQDHSMMPGDGMSSGGKKTRTKPIRNSEGILIRKDGRPDMRSVSSANNLRKVHAKKEAERAETDGRTPISARSLAPANSNSMSEDEEQSEEHGAEISRSVTPRTQAEMNGDMERPTHLEVPTMSVPTSASTDSAPKSAQESWYARRDERLSPPPETKNGVFDRPDPEQMTVVPVKSEGVMLADALASSE